MNIAGQYSYLLKVILRIKIILSGIIDDPEHVFLARLTIPHDSVDFPNCQVVAAIILNTKSNRR